MNMTYFSEMYTHACLSIYIQFWGKLLLKVMHYNIALLPKNKLITLVTFYGK